MILEPFTLETPREILIRREEPQKAEDARLEMLDLLKETVHFVIEQETDNYPAVLWAILYFWHDGDALAKSQRERQRELGTSHGLISHYLKKYEKECIQKLSRKSPAEARQ